MIIVIKWLSCLSRLSGDKVIFNYIVHRQNFRMFLKGQKVSEGNCGDYNFQKQTKKNERIP